MVWPDRPGDSDPDILETAPTGWARPRSLLERVPRRLMLVAAAALLAGGGAVLALSPARGASGTVRPLAHAVTVPAACGEFVNLTSPHVSRDFRVVLGDVAVPPAYLSAEPADGNVSVPIAGEVAQAGSPWPYGWQTAFWYRGDGPPVTISVPPGWRDRVTLFGPLAKRGAPGTLHIPSCPPRGAWDAYMSAFFVKTPSACVPLRIEAGRRTATVWFGLGRRC